MAATPKTKRVLKYATEFDGSQRTKFHVPGTKPARASKKMEAEIKRKGK